MLLTLGSKQSPHRRLVHELAAAPAQVRLLEPPVQVGVRVAKSTFATPFVENPIHAWTLVAGNGLARVDAVAYTVALAQAVKLHTDELGRCI